MLDKFVMVPPSSDDRCLYASCLAFLYKSLPILFRLETLVVGSKCFLVLVEVHKATETLLGYNVLTHTAVEYLARCSSSLLGMM